MKGADPNSADDLPSPTDSPTVDESVTGISGGLIGAALGTVGGPLATIIGAIAGAVGGCWAGRAVTESAVSITMDDEAYRTHYQSLPADVVRRRYEDIAHAYHLGHIARANPDYAGKTFEEIEPVLERGWLADDRMGDWASVRHYVAVAFTGTVNDRRLAADTRRLGGTPRTMTPTEAARDRLHTDTTTG